MTAQEMEALTAKAKEAAWQLQRIEAERELLRLLDSSDWKLCVCLSRYSDEREICLGSEQEKEMRKALIEQHTALLNSLEERFKLL